MKKLISSFFVMIAAVAVWSLEVNTSELKNVNDQNEIQFINYEGPHSVINSAASIKGIGSEIGSQVSNSLDTSNLKGNPSKYYVIHAVDLSVKGKLDADILVIGPDAEVDHINNLRRIISGYLSSAYNYSEQDSDTLAVFITVYNAVYRGFLDLLKNKYKDVVISNLDETNCGLSVNYEEWAGKSQIIIPLFDVMNGGISTIDTSVISDKSVVQSMKMDDDMNLESRKNLVDIKEREVDEATAAAKDAQKKSVENQKLLEKEKEKTAELKQEADESKAEAQEKKQIADENPENEELKKQAEEAQEEYEAKQSEYEAQKEHQQQIEKQTAESKEYAKEQQALADRKQTEAQSDRKEIAKDQTIVQEREIAQASIIPEYAIILVDGKKQFSRIVKYDSATGEVIKNSPVTVIRSREFYKVGNNYLAIAGENKKNGAVKLVLIDSEKLEIIAESTNVIAEHSVLISDAESYYCVIQENKEYYLGKFDTSLMLRMKSALPVAQNTSITVTENAIVVTGNDGKLKAFDKNDISSLLKK